MANNAKLAYQEMVEEYEKEECENLILSQSIAVNNQPETLLSKEILSTPSSSQAMGNNGANSILYNNSLYSNHPKVPSHMAHSRTNSNGSNISIEPYFMNYHTHSRSASGNFNYGTTTTGGTSGVVSTAITTNTTLGGHMRSASGGGAGTVFANIDLSMHAANKHWGTHSRTPSNCSNISFISRMSEPISEVGGSINTLFMGSVNNSTNNLAPYFGGPSMPGNSAVNAQGNTINSAFVAVQNYNEQVRQEMGECEPTPVLPTTSANKTQEQPVAESSDNNDVATTAKTVASVAAVTNAVVNLHLGSINEIDAGNEADTEGECGASDPLDKSAANKHAKLLGNKASSVQKCESPDNDSFFTKIVDAS